MENDKSIEGFKNYASFLKEVKSRIQKAQVQANFAATRELIILYWNVGRMVCAVQNSAGWGKRVIPRLSQDIKNELPEIKGFSVTNIKRMTLFYREYTNFNLIGPQAVGQIQEADNTDLQHLVTSLPWGHNVLLMEKIKDHQERGLIFCRDKNRVVAEYALQDLDKAIGVSEYQLTQTFPEELKSSLPTVDEIERESGRKE